MASATHIDLMTRKLSAVMESIKSERIQRPGTEELWLACR